jgi:hypothetical protein
MQANHMKHVEHWAHEDQMSLIYMIGFKAHLNS